jgi:di/tricarboxylate transporter
MPALDNILVLSVLAGTVVLFVTEKLRVDVVALCVLLALLLLKLIRPEQALEGFASAATATVAAMFVLSAGLVRTGFVAWLARHIDRLAGTTERRLVLVLCLTIAALSAFVVNTATVAIFIPVAIALGKTRTVPVSRVLIPLSFASQFGGVCTLIGTSTNILINTIAISYGLSGFGMFEFAPLGLIMSMVGITYLTVMGGWLLPRRRGTYQQTDKYLLADYLGEFRVRGGSPLVGKTWEKGRKKDLKNLDLIKIIRGKKATWRASATRIREGDVLLVHGDADELIKMKDHYGLETRGEATVKDEKLISDKINLVEALVPPRSRLVGGSLGGSDFVRAHQCIVLALQRRGQILRDRLADIQLEGGDTLLLQCERDDVERVMRSKDLIVTNELTDLHLRKERAAIALALVAAVVALSALNVMVVSGCLTPEEAYQSIDWKVVFLLGGTLPLGIALQQTGTAIWLVHTILRPLLDLGPLAVLAAVYIVTAGLTEAMSNNAAAILLAPIALSVATALGVSPRPFLVAITFAASTSFATPIGYQTNTMVYAPGGYRFTDYTRLGVPLNIVFWLIGVGLIPVLWPF